MQLSEEQKIEYKKIGDAVVDELTAILTRIHAPRLSISECYERVKEDTATICVLIVRGHLILKHKEGGTIHDTLKRFDTEDSKEDSSPQGKEAKDES